MGKYAIVKSKITARYYVANLNDPIEYISSISLGGGSYCGTGGIGWIGPSLNLPRMEIIGYCTLNAHINFSKWTKD